MVEHEALRRCDLQRLTARGAAGTAGDQPELTLLSRLGAEALRRTLLAEHEAGGVEGHGVL